MSTNKNLLLIRIRHKEKFGFVIPLALPVLEATLASLQDSLEIWEDIFPGLFEKLVPKHSQNKTKQMKFSPIILLVIKLIRELRKADTVELVHVEDGETTVSIKLF